MHIDIYTIVFAVIAVALLARLWSVLGTKREDERQLPNPFIPPTPPVQTAPDEPFIARQPVPPPAASLAGGLAQVKAADAAFDEKQFLKEVGEDLTAIVETYATGNLSGIADKMSPAMLAHFQSAVDARKAAGQTAQSRVAQLRDVEAYAARAEGTQTFVTVKFDTDQENILRDAHGAIIGGEAGKVQQVTDIWTFSRDAAVADSRWVLVETRG